MAFVNFNYNFRRLLAAFALFLTCALSLAAEAPPIFVLNSLDANVSLIDGNTFKEIRRIPTGKEPHHQYITPDGRSLIIANAAGNSLSFLDPATGAVQRVIRELLDPYHLRFSPDMKWFVTAANRLNHLDFHRWEDNAPKLVKRLPTGKTPSHMWIDSKNTVVYVTMQDSDELVAIDLNTQAIRWRVKTGSTPADVYLSADDKRVFVALTGADGVDMFDVGANPLQAPTAKRIKTGLGAHAFRARGDKRMIYVSNRAANTISLLDTVDLKVTETFRAPGGPDCIELSADGKTLFVSARWARKLLVIDTYSKEIRASVDVGRSPHGVWTANHAPRQ